VILCSCDLVARGRVCVVGLEEIDLARCTPCDSNNAGASTELHQRYWRWRRGAGDGVVACIEGANFPARHGSSRGVCTAAVCCCRPG